jgi:hypothetical protein
MVVSASSDLYSISHPASLDISTSEECYNLTNATIGIANAWTVSFWLKPALDAYTDARTVFQIQNNANANNRILATVQGDVANDPLRIVIADSTSAVIKQYEWDNAFNTTGWRLYTFTWNGTDLKYYQDGTFVTPTTITTDSTGSMDDSTRRGSLMTSIAGFSNLAGIAHSLAIWTTALTAANIVALYHGGSGYNYNVRNANDADLLTWELFGYSSGDVFHLEVGTYDIGADASGLTSADIVVDYPGI